MIEDGLDAVASRLGVEFSDPSLLRQALTHPSYSLEQGGGDYERLEFLGDSVLGWVVASRLYNDFPELPEGFLTRMKSTLARGRTLAEVARSLGLGDALLFGRGAVKEATRDSVLENAFEAVVGAVYLDQGADVATAFVLRMLGDRLLPELLLAESLNAKSRLQELTQSRGMGLPSYEIVQQSGPVHDPRFTAVACIAGKVCGTGTGTSKQEAQQAAAASALEVLDAE